MKGTGIYYSVASLLADLIADTRRLIGRLSLLWRIEKMRTTTKAAVRGKSFGFELMAGKLIWLSSFHFQ